MEKELMEILESIEERLLELVIVQSIKHNISKSDIEAAKQELIAYEIRNGFTEDDYICVSGKQAA